MQVVRKGIFILDLNTSSKRKSKIIYFRLADNSIHKQASKLSLLRALLSNHSSKLLMAFLVIAVAGFNVFYFSNSRKSDTSLAGKVLGVNTELNPQLADQIQAQENNGGSLTINSEPDDGNSFIRTAQAASLEDQEQGERKPFVYEVEGGDTLSSIAQKYNLKLNTILWANNLNEKTVIKPGWELLILPVDGILHKVEKGDTVSEIATLYKADTQKVIDYNGLSDVTKIHAGDMIIVPDGQPLPPPPTPKGNPVKSGSKVGGGQIPKGAVGSLVWPTTHRNVSQGYSASHRGLDIANGGKPAIIAAHSGKVEFAGNDGAWGNTIVIRGDDGLVTRYSHNSENYVNTGDPVSAGETIGKVGNTGNVRGKTGLHVDFRVYKNGVAINPKSLVK